MHNIPHAKLISIMLENWAIIHLLIPSIQKTHDCMPYVLLFLLRCLNPWNYPSIHLFSIPTLPLSGSQGTGDPDIPAYIWPQAQNSCQSIAITVCCRILMRSNLTLPRECAGLICQRFQSRDRYFSVSSAQQTHIVTSRSLHWPVMLAASICSYKIYNIWY